MELGLRLGRVGVAAGIRVKVELGLGRVEVAIGGVKSWGWG